MFGYVSVDKPSLRIREYDYYRATYCGLCHSMGKCTGCLSRMTLSYDMTFIALLREAIADLPVEFEKKRCIRHPFRARRVVKSNGELEYSAYVSGILTLNKIDDNINDEKGIKRFSAKLCRAFFGKMRRRSFTFSSEINGDIAELLKKLKAVENERVRSVDIPADIIAFSRVRSSLSEPNGRVEMISVRLNTEEEAVFSKSSERNNDVASASLIDPFLMGLITLSVFGALPIIFFASFPEATRQSFFLSIVITDGITFMSFSPPTQNAVYALPRSNPSVLPIFFLLLFFVYSQDNKIVVPKLFFYFFLYKPVYLLFA